MSPQRWLLGVIAIVATTVSLVQAQPLNPAPPGYRDVQFGPTVYRIPYARYHVGVQAYDAKSDHAAIGFSLILPDLAPSTSDPAEVATWGTGTGWHRELHILVEYGRNFISQRQQFDNAFSQSEKLKESAKKFDQEHGAHVMAKLDFLDDKKFTLDNNGLTTHPQFQFC